jgi:phenylacetic acid degradation operon negative regulatory protein
MNGIDCAEILEVFFWGFNKLSRPTFCNLLAGYPELSKAERITRMTQRLEALGLLKREGRGRSASFSITNQGLRTRRWFDPSGAWDKPWDGAWRMLMFDVPEVRRRDRRRLRKALRDRKFGLLQRSIWIWPHDLKPILQEVIEAEGVPECFCGCSTQELFLCSHADIVTKAWDFREIERRHRAYERHPSLSGVVLKKTTTGSSLVALARSEYHAYQHAFSIDPLLPRVLWPRSYRGLVVLRLHEQFRRDLARRLAQITRK